jgi:hypothetical protein
MSAGRIKIAVALSTVLAGAAAIGWASYSTIRESEAKNAPARAAGFIDADEMDRARAAGFARPDEWRAERERREAIDRIAKAQAEAKAAAISAKLKAEKAEADAKEKARKQVEEEHFQAGVRVALVLRESMKNPDSFNLESVTRTHEGSMCFNYRATNSFNAIIPGQAVIPFSGSAASTGDAQFISKWNKFCANKPAKTLENVPYAIKNFYPRK